MLFLKSRAWLTATLAGIAFELTLPAWAGQAFGSRHGSFYIALSLAVPAQIVATMAILYVCRSNFAELEAGGSRNLKGIGIAALASSVLLVGAACSLASQIIGPVGTVASDAPVTTLVGCLGIGLCAEALVDRRLAGLVALPPIIAPLVTDPRGLPLSQFWSFVSGGAPDPNPWPWAWLIVGLVVYAIGGRQRRVRP